MDYPLRHYEIEQLTEPIDIQDTTYSLTREFAVRMANMFDDAIMKAILDEAKKEGLTDLFVLDKQFVFDAIREKIERDKQPRSVKKSKREIMARSMAINEARRKRLEKENEDNK